VCIRALVRGSQGETANVSVGRVWVVFYGYIELQVGCSANWDSVKSVVQRAMEGINAECL
jgi:hypothetical protein